MLSWTAPSPGLVRFAAQAGGGEKHGVQAASAIGSRSISPLLRSSVSTVMGETVK